MTEAVVSEGVCDLLSMKSQVCVRVCVCVYVFLCVCVCVCVRVGVWV